ncbi:MAG: hypothetical protein K0Q50_2607 [Vampirovibrio sp.]|jgi:hypothetical protein|nr:hypothetical protein [Vampirovibrio sp.]
MMKYCIFTLISLVLFGTQFALAEPKVSVSSELSGVRNVMKVIRHVSLRQVDLKSRQPMLDIMDIKGQTEALKARPEPVKASILNAPARVQGRKVPTIRPQR